MEGPKQVPFKVPGSRLGSSEVYDSALGVLSMVTVPARSSRW